MVCTSKRKNKYQFWTGLDSTQHYLQQTKGTYKHALTNKNTHTHTQTQTETHTNSFIPKNKKQTVIL